METQIIDFAQWYSGMERSKVEAAYQRFFKERKEALSQAAVIKSVCPKCGSKCNGTTLVEELESQTKYINSKN